MHLMPAASVAQKQPSAADRRAHERLHYNSLVNVTVMQDGRVSAQIVQSSDISVRGLAFTFRGAIPSGTRVELQLCRWDGRQDRIASTVMHCDRLENGTSVVGVLLDQPIDPRTYVGATQASSLA